MTMTKGRYRAARAAKKLIAEKKKNNFLKTTKNRLAAIGVTGAVQAFARKALGQLVSNLRFNIVIIILLLLIVIIIIINLENPYY